MELMFVPKPVFDRNKEVKGYYISYQVGNALLEEVRRDALELSLESPFLKVLNEVGLEVLTFNKPIFIPVTNVVLATELELGCKTEPSSAVLLLDRKNELSQANLQRVKRFKGLDFKIAFMDLPDSSALDAFLPYTDYIFERDLDRLEQLMLRAKKGRFFNVSFIASGVDTAEQFDEAATIGTGFFDGNFYRMPSKGKNNKVNPLQVNYLQILNQVNKDDFDFEQFVRVVSRDTALALQFLRMVNSSHVRQNKIKSLKHAAAMLGQKEIRRWITTAVASTLSQDKPGEITRASLLRARFCENMARHFEMAIQSENLFLMGLFSVLDVILDLPMEKALELVSIPDKIRDALVHEKGEYAQVYRFIKLYEQGDWREVSRLALVHNIKIRDIASAYLDTLTWYGRLINMKVDDAEL